MLSAATYLTSVPYLGTLSVRGNVVATAAKTDTQSKLEKSVKVDVLTREDIPKAADTAVAALKDDPVWRYTTETPDARPPHGDPEKGAKKIWSLILGREIKNNLAFTVNAGEAFITATPAKPDRKPVPPIQKIINAIVFAFFFLLQALFQTREQKRRSKEVKHKIGHLVKKNIGDKIEEYIYLSILAVAPEAQGKGYGTALVQTITNIADLQGRKTWLITSSESNVDFYDELGFKEVDRALLGDHNPTWEEDPIPVPLLVREPKEKKPDEKAIFMV